MTIIIYISCIPLAIWAFFLRFYFFNLFGGVIFPDGTMAIDYIEEIIEHQKVFMEVVSEIRSENMFTFPVKEIAA